MPSQNNLIGTPLSTSIPELTGKKALAFFGRRQTDTLFTFSVDRSFSSQAVNQEAGGTLFLTQFKYIDLAAVLLQNLTSKPQLLFRFCAIGTVTPPAPNLVSAPISWVGSPIRLRIQAINATHYSLAAMPAASPDLKIILGTAFAALVSGGDRSFVGSLVGVYATCNWEGTAGSLDCPAGGNAYFQRRRYTRAAQYITATESIPAVINLMLSEV